MDVPLKMHKRTASEQFQRRFLGKASQVTKDGHTELISNSKLFPIERVCSKPIQKTTVLSQDIQVHIKQKNLSNMDTSKTFDKLWQISQKMSSINPLYLNYIYRNPYLHSEQDSINSWNFSVDLNNSRLNNSALKKTEINSNKIPKCAKFNRIDHFHTRILLDCSNLKKQDSFEYRDYSINMLKLSADYTKSAKNIKKESISLNNSFDHKRSYNNLKKEPIKQPKIDTSSDAILKTNMLITPKPIFEQNSHKNTSLYKHIFQSIIKRNNSVMKNRNVKSSYSTNLKKAEERKKHYEKQRNAWLEKVTGMHGFLDNIKKLKC